MWGTYEQNIAVLQISGWSSVIFVAIELYLYHLLRKVGAEGLEDAPTAIQASFFAVGFCLFLALGVFVVGLPVLVFACGASYAWLLLELVPLVPVVVLAEKWAANRRKEYHR